MNNVFVPDCMTDREFLLWQRANWHISDHRLRASRPCLDCPMAFADEMRLAGRCNGTPKREAPSKHDPRRLLQWRQAQARKRAGLRVRRSPAEVAELRERVRSIRAQGKTWAGVGAELGIAGEYARSLAA